MRRRWLKGSIQDMVAAVAGDFFLPPVFLCLNELDLTGRRGQIVGWKIILCLPAVALLLLGSSTSHSEG